MRSEFKVIFCLLEILILRLTFIKTEEMSSEGSKTSDIKDGNSKQGVIFVSLTHR